jgi:hypothetical protein
MAIAQSAVRNSMDAKAAKRHIVLRKICILASVFWQVYTESMPGRNVMTFGEEIIAANDVLPIFVVVTRNIAAKKS